MATTAKLLVEVSAIDKRFASTLKGIEAKAGRFAKRMEGIGRAIAAGFALPAGLIAAGVFRAFAGFDKAVTQGLARVDEVTDGLREKVERAATAISEELPVSATQAAAAFGELAAAGLKGEEAVAAMPRVAKLAAAGQLDLADATRLLVGSLTAMGEDIGQAERFSDALVKGANLSTASVKDLAESLSGDAGPQLRLFNVSVEEAVAVLAVYANQNIRGAEASQKLFQFIRDLTLKATENAEAFRDAGVAVFDDVGAMRSLADIVSDLERRLSGLSSEERRLEIRKLGLAEKSLQATLALIGFSSTIRDFTGEIKEAGGITDRVAKFQIQNLSDQFVLLKNRLVNAAIAIGGALAPSLQTLTAPIESAIGQLRVFAEFLAGLPAGTKDAIIGIGAFGIALSALVIAFGVAARAMQALVLLFKELALAVIRHPVLFLAAAVITLGVDLFAMSRKATAAKDQLKALGDSALSTEDRIRGLIDSIAEGKKKIEELEKAAAAARAELERGNKSRSQMLGGGRFGDEFRSFQQRDVAKAEGAVEAERQTQAAKEAKLAIDQVALANENFVKAINRATMRLRVNGDELENLQSRYRAYEHLLEELSPLMSHTDEQFQTSKTFMAALAKQIEEVTKKRAADVDGIRGESDALRELAKEEESLRLQQMLGGDVIQGLQQQYQLLEQKILATAEAMRAKGATDAAIIAATQAMRLELSVLDQQLIVSQSSWVQWGMTVGAMFQEVTFAAVQFGELTFQAFESFSTGIGQAFAQALVFGESFRQSFVDMAKQVAAQFISSLISMAIQLVAFALLQKTIGMAGFTQVVGAQAGQAFAGGFASVMTAVPFPANIFLAPIVAGAAAASTKAGAQALASFDVGGMTKQEGLAYLHPREVITPIDRVWDMVGGEKNQMQTLILEIDGLPIARAVMQHLPRVARLKFGGAI